MNENAVSSLVIIIDSDGMIFYMGKLTDVKTHVEYLNTFLKQNYDGFDDFDNSTPANVVIDTLTDMGNVVFLNERLFGAIFIPTDLTEKQLSSIDTLAIEFGDRPVVLNQKPNMDLGYPLYQVDASFENVSLKELVDKYLECKQDKGHQK